MSTDLGYCVCDFCGSDNGEFNENGNHVSCVEIAALRSRLAEAEGVMEQIANRLRVNKETAITDNPESVPCCGIATITRLFQVTKPTNPSTPRLDKILKVVILYLK